MLRSFGTIGSRPILRFTQPLAWTSNGPASRAAAVTHSLVSTHLWRSFFYVPGNKAKMIQKIAQLPTKLAATDYGTHIPDLIVLDCEDAVGLDEKDEARRTVCDSLKSANGSLFQQLREELKRLLIVRINSVNEDMAKVDLDAVLDASFEAVEKNGGHWPGPDLFCLPKVESADELTWLSETINQQLGRSNLLRNRPNLGLVAMIESCTAVIQLPVICQKATCLSIPLVGVVFGSDDYCVTLGVERSPTNMELSHPRQFVPVVAKAFGLAAIDMVDIDFKDNAKLNANCALGAQFGFDGKQTIHPAQLPVVNQAFAPSQSREEWANALLKAAKAHHSTGQAVGAHAFTFRGRMIDRPTLRQAEHIVNLTKLVNLRAQAQ